MGTDREISPLEQQLAVVASGGLGKFFNPFLPSKLSHGFT